MRCLPSRLLRAMLLQTDTALQALDAAEQALARLWPLDLLARGKRRESFNAKVNACDRIDGRGLVVALGIDLYRDKPSACAKRDDGAQDHATQTRVLVHTDPAEFGNTDAIPVQIELIVPERKALIELFFLEAWIEEPPLPAR